MEIEKAPTVGAQNVTPLPTAGLESVCQAGASQSSGGEFEDKLGIK